MKKLFHQIARLFRPKRTRLVLALILGLGVAILLYFFAGELFHSVQAAIDPVTGETIVEEGEAPPSENDEDGGFFSIFGEGVGTVVASLATLFIKLLAGILWFVLYWMGDLMDNTFLLEGDIGEKLRSVWVIVRNFVNIFFAFMLVIAALINIVGYGEGEGNYTMKKFIPKMAVALIAVNFTFLACRLVLDLNNVLTTAIFSIPQSVTNLSDIGPSGAGGIQIFKKFKCLDDVQSFQQNMDRIKILEEKFPGVINSLGGVCFAVNPDGESNTWDQKTLEAETAPLKQAIVDLNSSQFNKKDFVWAMATQFQGIHNLNKVSQLTDNSFTGLTVNALFSIIFAVIYATAYVAMFIILMARMIMLWIYIMLSPLAALQIVIPDLLPEQLSVKKFISEAFVPAKMAIPISFGYILISQMQVSIDTSSGITSDKAFDISSGEFAHDISITTLLYGAASIGVIWTGVFAASKDVAGSGFVEQVEGFVKGAGQTVAKWPTYLPVFPVPGGTASFKTIAFGVKEFQEEMDANALRKDQDSFQKAMAALHITTNDVRRNSEEIMRVVQAEGAIIKSDIAGKMTELAKSDSNAFLRVIKEVQTRVGNGTLKRDSVDNIRTAFGLGRDADLANMNPEELLKAAKAAAPKAGESVSANDYSSVSGIGGIQVAAAALAPDIVSSLQSIPDSLKDALGITRVEGVVTGVDLGNTNAKDFMEKIKAVGEDGLRALIDSGILDKLADNKKAREIMAKDEEFQNCLKKPIVPEAESTDETVARPAKAVNQRIRAVFQKIFQDDTSIDLNKKSGITDQGIPTAE